MNLVYGTVRRVSVSASDLASPRSFARTVRVRVDVQSGAQSECSPASFAVARGGGVSLIAIILLSFCRGWKSGADSLSRRGD